MRTISDGLAAHLREPATTLAAAWRLTRRDGRVLGFTDHDEDLRFAGTLFAARSGWAGGEGEAVSGFAAATEGVEGTLSSEAIREEDIAAGLYDGASVETFRVNWQAPQDHVSMGVADLGEVRRSGDVFSAELRGIEARLDRQRGRYYRRRCDAVLGDRRCGVDLGEPRWHRAGLVLERMGEDALLVSGLGRLDRTVFARGRLDRGSRSWTVASLAEVGENCRVNVVEPLHPALIEGAAVTLRAGCDKSFSTCRGRFGNGLNFRGFPHIPGTDAALGIAKSDGMHDGSPVVP